MLGELPHPRRLLAAAPAADVEVLPRCLHACPWGTGRERGGVGEGKGRGRARGRERGLRFPRLLGSRPRVGVARNDSIVDPFIYSFMHSIHSFMHSFIHTFSQAGHEPGHQRCPAGRLAGRPAGTPAVAPGQQGDTSRGPRHQLGHRTDFHQLCIILVIGNGFPNLPAEEGGWGTTSNIHNLV